ncbi:hypothetical protein [Sphingomonas sp. PAMC26645]|nr:hypothetical protein [Sphingomonas sp. PAMC26645]
MKSIKTAVIAPSAVALSAAGSAPRIGLALETVLAAFDHDEHFDLRA